MPTLTIHEVAKVAGVSKSTVSRVINRSPRVAADVAQAVRQAMLRVGYQPPTRRPGPKSSRRKGIHTGNVLFLVLGHSLDYGLHGYPNLLRGVENALGDNQLKMVLASLETGGSLPVALDSGEVDGVLLFGNPQALSASAKARLREIPAVCLMRGMEEFRGQLDRVSYNNAAVGPMAARYLAGRGHQRVGFYHIDPTHTAVIPRQRDFTRVAEELGMEVVTLAGQEPPAGLQQEIEAHRLLAERIKATNPSLTGLFIPGDYWAPYAYQAMASCGLGAGRDIDIISCDNVPLFLDQLDPRPATIDINLPLVGATGVRQLMWRMANPALRNTVELLVEPVLVEGACPAPNAGRSAASAL